MKRIRSTERRERPVSMLLFNLLINGHSNIK